VYQDIAPRNLLIGPTTDHLRLFDFDRTARIGPPGCNDSFEIPDIPPSTPLITGHGERIRETRVVEVRTDAVKHKQNVIFWERPPHHKAYLQQNTERHNSA
jgi:hypothetical protein